MSSGSLAYPARAGSARPRALALFRTRPELVGLLGLSAVLNLWNLQINGWANTYYSAAVRSMSTSWHDFLFASLDRSGLMTVDKPPLALWVQALSVRVFGFHPLSILVPEALMGVLAVGLVYDLVRRRFGRGAGFAAGLVFATTPITVAIARHNNPDELLVLCTVAALWCAVRGMEQGRTRWLVASGVCIGLGFETKMAVALLVVPAIALAWWWSAPRRLAALRQLLGAGAAMASVALAWPLAVTLTPAADRPWVSGTSDNSIWSLIFGYNGLGRVAGQSGGPGGVGGGGGAGGSLFGGPTGVFRLLGSALGDQAGWLLGVALVGAIALVAMTRLRRGDPRTGWLIAVGGSAVTTAVVFSFAQGIFHPYYVSFLAPFTAALIGATLPTMLRRGPVARIVAPAAILAGVVTELVVLNEIGGALGWAEPVLLVGGVGTATALALRLSPRLRAGLVALALAGLVAAPATWAAETLGHATSTTFPAGGPASAATAGPGGGPGGGRPAGAGGSGGGAGRFGQAPGAIGFGGPPPGGGAFGGPPRGLAGGAPAGGGFGGGATQLAAAIRYARARGGGAIGVDSQSTAAEAILTYDGEVAGLGGFSGRESSVSLTWLAAEVRAGRLRWIVSDGSQGQTGLPGDTRTGSQSAIAAAAQACRRVRGSSVGSSMAVYDCQGRAAAILGAGRRS